MGCIVRRDIAQACAGNRINTRESLTGPEGAKTSKKGLEMSDFVKKNHDLRGQRGLDGGWGTENVTESPKEGSEKVLFDL